jgi:lipopolysaccharide/colanic/teichoic acid biosynthesis glycosyltransferase
MEVKKTSKGGFYRRFVKRPMDFTLSLLAILVLSPVILILAILVRIKHGAPVLFKQKRPGMNEKIFTIYKFRTMTNKKDEQGNLLPDAERLTGFGTFLRSTSLDELPGLFNILLGHMSIVGPRPLLIQYLPLYNERQKRRHEVRPGLTGLAQVNGRNALDWQTKFELDVQYVDTITFLGDIKIIIKTALKVLKREGINSGTAATMEAFTGNHQEESI